MGCTFIVAEDTIWVPQCGQYDVLVQGLSAELEGIDQRLADALLWSQTELSLRELGLLGQEPDWLARQRDSPIRIVKGMGFCDLTRLNAKRFRTLLKATCEFFDHTAEAGLSAFGDQWGFRSVFLGTSYVKALLRFDPRSGEDHSVQGSIIVRDGAVWAAPSWAYDMICEHFAGWVVLDDPELARFLIAARVQGGSGKRDLRSLNSESLAELRPAMEWLSQRYGIEADADSGRPNSADVQLVPLVRDLAKLFRTSL